MLLRVENAVKTFRLSGAGKGQVTPLNGVDLQLDCGQKIGIIGKSGQGKSTLARIICGFTAPDFGNVFFNEIPLYSGGRYDRESGVVIQYVPQQPYLSFDPLQRVGNAVIETLIVQNKTLTRKQAKNEALRLFEKVRLDAEIFDRLPAQLSGGQVQRAAIARALAVGPEILISDEATSMLDVSAQAQIIELLNSLVTSEKLAVILISHDEKLVAAFADKTYRLADGKLYQEYQEKK